MSEEKFSYHVDACGNEINPGEKLREMTYAEMVASESEATVGHFVLGLTLIGLMIWAVLP